MASPRQRAARWRYVQYAVLVAVLVAIAFLADWGQIQRVLELGAGQGAVPRVLTIALKNTIIYTACGFTFGLALGLFPGTDAPLERRPLPMDRDGRHRALPWSPRPGRLHRPERRFPIGLPGLRDPVRQPRRRHPRPRARSGVPTWPRRSGPASEPCPRVRWRPPARSASRTGRR
ncbi:hypothetical protein [Nocardioides sp. B-3]|uniref:hypothetical protein n=1 Tax=Nocardioides sp. B-3 TaxID=2895565 RepID=UPI0021539064|nr:hypothetical protein [Nocardioides sp. B-3]UUZ60100.1 hypothetical protein LP418_03760 [Nocardioides sp. B-3]